MENDGISISDGQEPTVNTEEQGVESNDDALLTLDGGVDKVDDPVVVTSAGNNLNEEDADNDVLIISEQGENQESPTDEQQSEINPVSPYIETSSHVEECSLSENHLEDASVAPAAVSTEQQDNRDASVPGSSEPETEAIHADTPNDDNICKECNVPATIKRFRREGGRIRKGQQVRWICKYKCPNCSAFFGDEWQLDSTLQTYKKYISEGNKPRLDSEPMCDPSTNGIISAEVCKADEAQENIPQSPVESVSDMNDATSSNTTMAEANTNTTPSQLSSSERSGMTSRGGGRRNHTTRKNTRHSGPATEEKEPEEPEEAVEVVPEPAPVPIAVDNIVIETVILAPIEKRKPGRPRKRQAEPEVKPSYQPPWKIMMPPPKEEKPTEEEIIAARTKSIMEAVLSKLELGPVCSEEASTSSDSLDSYKDRVIARSTKSFGIMKYTIDRLKTENMRLSSTLKDLNHKFCEHARASRLQGNGIIAMVDSLNKELKFFKNECVSEARATNDLFKKQQADFEVKYGYRVMEKDIVQSHLDNLQTRFENAKLQMREMADDLARQDNEIREFERLKETADQGKYMRCQTCEANEVLLEKLRPELAKLRKEKGDWDKKYKQMEKEAEAAKERLKVVENELKKQAFISRSYEALDKQTRAKEQEARLALTKATPKANDDEKTTDEPKKDQKKDSQKLPSFSDMVDPEILEQATKMGSSLPPMFRAPNREAINGTGSVAITPESPHSEAGHQNHSKGHPAQSPGQFRPNHQRPPHKSLTAKYAPQPPPRPTNSKPTFLCHQPDAHLPRASYPGPSKHPSSWQKEPESLRNQGPPRPGQPPERRMDWTAYLSQRRSNN